MFNSTATLMDAKDVTSSECMVTLEGATLLTLQHADYTSRVNWRKRPKAGDASNKLLLVNQEDRIDTQRIVE